MQPPVLVLNAQTKRETGRRAQMQNIVAGKAVADIIRTCLGPKAMLKMLLDTGGSIVITNDGNSILREIDVSHPAAKSMIDLARAQDDEVGDGTTSVVILAGEVLACVEPLIQKGMHPTIIISGMTKALDDIVDYCNTDAIGFTVDINNKEEMTKILKTCIGTKFTARWSDLLCQLALDAVMTVANEDNGFKEVDIKRFIRIEKIPGGNFEDSRVVRGCAVNKDVLHPQMKRRIENPRILLLDCPLEYKKGESQTDVEVVNADDFGALLKLEEDAIQQMCVDILKFKPDIVITEKGLSDLAQHYLVKNGVTALRRFRKTDTTRIGKACGATIVSRTDEIEEKDIGTGCGLFEVKKIGDEYFSFFDNCKDPKACTIILRGASKDVLNELDRNIQDALCVAKNVVLNPRLVPGGGAVEMALACHLNERAKSLEGVQHLPYRAVAEALEVIPRTLANNCGAKTVRVITELRAKHAADPQANSSWGIDGEAGVLADMKAAGIWEPHVVKLQSVKSAVEAACLLLRVDDIISGVRGKKEGGGGGGGGGAPPAEEDMEM